MLLRTLFALLIVMTASTLFAQTPPVEPGVSHDLAVWRAARYSDVRYKLNLTLEKMSPGLKGTIEIRVKVAPPPDKSEPPASAGGFPAPPIVLDWRKIKGSETLSSISNVSVNGTALRNPPAHAGGSDRYYDEANEHLIFRDGVVAGENVIKLDFTSPILASGSAITRYVDKEDGAEYIYSLFVPSDASTAFPVFDQPDLKARFQLNILTTANWKVVSNTASQITGHEDPSLTGRSDTDFSLLNGKIFLTFAESKPISTYVFAFAAGPFEKFASNGSEPGAVATGSPGGNKGVSGSQGNPVATARGSDKAVLPMNVYVRRSQAEKFKQHAAEVFRLNREGIKFLEQYFDYKFPFPKYDLVLIPEFPFGGMEHAGATFLREDRVIFPHEPTKNDYVTRANVIFHEAAHQWFGDTVTMKWFDDLWLKEGFAEFMAYKTLERVMPEYNAWKIFYERNKQLAYLTDTTKGTTPIYQEIKNLSAAKSAYGNIVYRKAPSFLRQAEFYIGEDKFQAAVRAFLKNHEFANAGWEDLVKEFEAAIGKKLNEWATAWVKVPGVAIFRATRAGNEREQLFRLIPRETLGRSGVWRQKINIISPDIGGLTGPGWIGELGSSSELFKTAQSTAYVFPNYQDYGYGIFLLDDKSRDYVLKNIQNEKDDFLRTMMWGSLSDSVREAELDPKEYVELVIKNLSTSNAFTREARLASERVSSTNARGEPAKITPKGVTRTEDTRTEETGMGETDESTIQTLLGRVSTAMTYYLDEKQRDEISPRLEAVLIGKMLTAPTPGQRITFYRSFLNVASTENSRRILKEMLYLSLGLTSDGGKPRNVKPPLPEAYKNSKGDGFGYPTLKTKDKFDIVTKLLILGDPDAAALLTQLEKSETSDEAKRYAYAAKAGIATAEYKAKFWTDFTNNKDISESWIESAFGPFNSTKHADLTLPYLEKALAELPKLKRDRKIFFVNGWLGAFIGGQKSEQALAVVNKFLVDNPNLDNDLRLKILENVDLIERAVEIRAKYAK